MVHKRRATSLATVNSRRYPVISSLSREVERAIVAARGCVTTISISLTSPSCRLQNSTLVGIIRLPVINVMVDVECAVPSWAESSRTELFRMRSANCECRDAIATACRVNKPAYNDIAHQIDKFATTIP